MSSGAVVFSPEGERIVLADVGQVVLLDNPVVRVWEVSLAPGEVQPWHLHHNPYVVLNVEASPGRMDWLDGSEPRYLDEYRGGAVLRPTSPVHRLTNIGGEHYRNRLIELKDLGEHRGSEGPSDIGRGDRSVAGQRPGPAEVDGRKPVLLHTHVRVWDAEPATRLELSQLPHVLVPLDARVVDADPAGGVRFHPGGPLRLPVAWAPYLVVELSYLADSAQQEGNQP